MGMQQDYSGGMVLPGYVWSAKRPGYMQADQISVRARADLHPHLPFVENVVVLQALLPPIALDAVCRKLDIKALEKPADDDSEL